MTGERAVSDVIGFVLVFALVASTVAIVSVSGLSSLEAARDAEQVDNAERAFDVLADNMADIYGEGAPSRATEISLEESRLETGDPVTVNITRVTASGTQTNNFTSLPIVYVGRNDERVVYSNGAVLREQRQGGLVVEDPPLLLSSERVVIPVVQTRAADRRNLSVSGTTVRIRAEKALRAPLISQPEAPAQDVILNVTTPRNEIWKRYLDRQPDTTCTTPRESTVECTVSDPDRLYVSLVRIDVDFEF
jgi:hypothetical protein